MQPSGNSISAYWLTPGVTTNPSYFILPTIALSNTDSPMYCVHIVTTCTSKGTYSLGLMWCLVWIWLVGLIRLARKLYGAISCKHPWKATPNFCMYRHPKCVEKEAKPLLKSLWPRRMSAQRDRASSWVHGCSIWRLNWSEQGCAGPLFAYHLFPDWRVGSPASHWGLPGGFHFQANEWARTIVSCHKPLYRHWCKEGRMWIKQRLIEKM